MPPHALPGPTDLQLPVRVAAFYRFVSLPDLTGLQHFLRDLCPSQGIRGTILLAAEGINGTIAGTPDAIDTVFAGLRAWPGLEGLSYQSSHAAFLPFDRLKVRRKAEIVTLRATADPRLQVGTYVEPEDWNALISDPNMVVIDTRNHHEVVLGTFQGALDPQTRSFGEFPAFVAEHLDPRRPVAMFCTGGIRCEKATSYLLSQGFERVYHLRGGILNYLRCVPAEASLWQGECFIFDQRYSLGHHLIPRFTDPDEARAHLHDGWAASAEEAAGEGEVAAHARPDRDDPPPGGGAR